MTCPLSHDDKDATGSLPSPVFSRSPSPRISPLMPPGLLARKKSVHNPAWSTGSSASCSARKSLLRDFNNCMEPMEDIMSSPDLMLPLPMSRRKRLGLRGPASNVDVSHSNETTLQTGIEYGNWQPQEPFSIFLQIFEFHTTVPSEEYLPTILVPFSALAESLFSGDLLVLEKQKKLGSSLVWTLTLRSQPLNSGTAIVVRKTSLLMNFVEKLASLTCSAGSIATHVLLKSRVVQPSYWQNKLLSPQTLILGPGIPNLMEILLRL